MSTPGLKVFESFDAMKLELQLLCGIFRYNFSTPSYIQQRAIVPVIQGKNVIAQAKSGSGKTATFGIASLQIIKPRSPSLQVLVLSPTRELAAQTADVLEKLGESLNIKPVVCTGAVKAVDLTRQLDRGSQLISGTVGRVLDMKRQNKINFNHLKLLVIDEADEMLERGFIEKVYEICNKLIPKTTQIALFSATITQQVRELEKQCLGLNPVRILVENEALSVKEIAQYYVNVGEEEYKVDTLFDLYDQLVIVQSVIFCNSRQAVDKVTSRLKAQRFPAAALHGDVSKADREAVMDAFRAGKTRMLVASDLLARGIDVQQVSHVINYDVPTAPETYIHRIGRSGRFGRRGMAITLATEDDVTVVHDLEELYEVDIDPLPSDLTSLN